MLKWSRRQRRDSRRWDQMTVMLPIPARRIEFVIRDTHSRGLDGFSKVGASTLKLRVPVGRLPLPGELSRRAFKTAPYILGYYDGPIDAGLLEEDSRQSHWLGLCVRRFQHDENLPETGEIDSDTEQALGTAYGDGRVFA